MVDYGRGAWTAVGMPTNAPYYELSNPEVGSQVVANNALDPSSFNIRAVNFGVKAIQTRLNEMGYRPALGVDGVLGPFTSAGIKWLQVLLNMKNGYTPGVLGTSLSRALFRPLVIDAEVVNHIPGNHLGGIMMHESGADPGAVGYFTHYDKGLFQFNCDPAINPPYTIADAFDYRWAIKSAAVRLRSAREKFAGKTVELQTDCSIASHNSPVFALEWFNTGAPPNQAIQNYVHSVLDQASIF